MEPELRDLQGEQLLHGLLLAVDRLTERHRRVLASILAGLLAAQREGDGLADVAMLNLETYLRDVGTLVDDYMREAPKADRT